MVSLKYQNKRKILITNAENTNDCFVWLKIRDYQILQIQQPLFLNQKIIYWRKILFANVITK